MKHCKECGKLPVLEVVKAHVEKYGICQDCKPKRTRCSKHCWIALESSEHMTKMDLTTGGINLYYLHSEIEVCIVCDKVRGKLIPYKKITKDGSLI